MQESWFLSLLPIKYILMKTMYLKPYRLAGCFALLFATVSVFSSCKRDMVEQPIPAADATSLSDDIPLSKPTIRSFFPQSGERGTIVTISGKGFGDSAEVKMNNVICPVISVTATAIKIRIPDNVWVVGDNLTVSTLGETLQTASRFEVTNIWAFVKDVEDRVFKHSNDFARIGDDIYYGFGGTSNPFLSNEFWKYSITSGTFTLIHPDNNDPDKPGKRADGRMAALNGKIYLVGGGNGTNLHDLWEYDPLQNKWTLLNNSATHLQGETHPFVYNNELYFYTWTTSYPETISRFNFTTRNTELVWDNVQTGELTMTRPVVVGNKIYLVGGIKGTGGSAYGARSIVSLDLAAKQSKIHTYPTDVWNWPVQHQFIVHAIGNNIYFGGTYLNSGYYLDFYQFNTVSNTLTKLAPVANNLMYSNQFSYVQDDMIYARGFNTIYRYKPSH
jgi:hypothetical protein